MKITNVRIRNFRTIRNEVSFDVPNIISIVGPNNSGKSNIARAIEIFFTGRSKSKYDPAVDLPHGVTKEKTSITVSFRPEEGVQWDENFRILHDQLRTLHPTPPERDRIISLNLYFTDMKPVYQFFGNAKRPTEGAKNAQYSRIQSELLDLLFDHFQVYYVPSAKSFNEIFVDFIFPELKYEINPTVIEVIPNINNILGGTSNSINGYLRDAGLPNIVTDISISETSVNSLISKIDFMIADNISTEISRKGTGIQATAILAALRWIDEKKRASGREVLWIIEEPESYLHPELTRCVNKIVEMLSSNSTVLLTTHALAFVPKTVENILGCEKSSGNTIVTKFPNFYEATSRIRKSIGVKFSDYYNLDKINIAVEGKTDRSIIESVLKKMTELNLLPSDDVEVLNSAKFITFTGVRDLAEFVRVTYEFVSQECVFVTILDGDDAGVKYRKDLQQFLSNRKPPVVFESNRNFVSVRSGFAIEGLFPDHIIKAAYERNPTHFSSYSEDASGMVEPFTIHDQHKGKVQNFALDTLLSSALPDDFQRFLTLFGAVAGAIRKLQAGFGASIFD